MAERIPALKQVEQSPKPRRGSKLRRILIALFLIVLVVLFFRSSLSKFSEIRVSGTSLLKQEDVLGALGTVPGDSFFFPSVEKLEKRVMTLKPLASVKVTKKFPGVLQVEVKEHPQVAVQLAPDGNVFTVLANGLVLPIADGKLPDKPILSGWKPEDANMAALCVVLSGLPDYMLSDLSEIRPDPSVAYPDRIKLFTRSKFEVVTTVGKLADRISYLSDIVQNREPGRIVMLEADTYLPYSAENGRENPQEADKLKEKDSTQ